MDGGLEYPVEWFDRRLSDGSTQMFHYVSCIKVNGRPILPPIITEEKKREIASWRLAAIKKEEEVRRQRSSSVSSDGFGRDNVMHSTPTRPATLNLSKRGRQPNTREPQYRESLENRFAQESESEVESERKQWSPLKTDLLQDVKLKVSAETGSTQDTPETVTGSPRNGSFQRQNSYTVLNPSPALMNYLAKEEERAQSGRRTWDLRSARETWRSQRPIVTDSEEDSDDLSPPANDSNATQVPCLDDVPSSLADPSGQSIIVPNVVKEKINSLTVMMMSLKMRHEQQRLELEKRQLVEQEKFETLFKEKISDLLGMKKSCSVSTVNLVRDPSWTEGVPEILPRSIRSAGDARPKFQPPDPTENGRSRSADPFGSVTDIDISLRDDSCVSKGAAKRDEFCETWSLSSRASTLSNEALPVATYRIESRYRQLNASELQRCNRAAAKICAAVKGYLTRRLMRTEFVKDLFRSLRDTIHMAKSLKDAKDLHASDLNFMMGLTRQINSNWDAIYEVFMRTSKEKQMQLIAADRARQRTSQTKTPVDAAKRISSATLKSLSRKQKAMSTSLTSFPRSSSFSRSCFKMSTSLSGALPPRRQC